MLGVTTFISENKKVGTICHEITCVLKLSHFNRWLFSNLIDTINKIFVLNKLGRDGDVDGCV